MGTEPEDPFLQNTESLANNHEILDKLRLVMWSTTVKPLKIVQLVRNEIPDCKDSDARNVVHDTSELLKKRILQVQEILEVTAQRSPSNMTHRSGRAAERPSPNPRSRQQSRMSGPTDSEETSTPSQRGRTSTTATSSASTAGAQASSGQEVPAADASMLQQLFVMMTQQNQKFQAAIQTQKQQAQAQLELLMLQRRKHYTGTSQAHLANSSRPLLTASVVAWIQRI
ncbi:hypothetical protein PC116_g12532 [Phytophthora cactorum]|uniref:Uncharacterized protein n=1 Tax=Phytophthora cactorum TaxID=29920 RepID=A0A8T1KWI6_9STRA|nr:hypothetical protein PC112_g11459 [Phytophthora cactorum]KAG2825768.1 hypothetical protein PC111_g9244 [Phytophthora cactorum]KAG2904043.1 hypothetical protein PC114_g12017 [Phytophthora cactorum]KAG2919161.1 hypothetical protein PC115_g10230 [Phytophthora cactorum]KAG2960203.1 hypothetical protein PC118_g22641 [Phytophthora cactorum]